MNNDHSGALVGLLLGVLVLSLLGYSGIRSLVAGLRSSSMNKRPPIFNHFGVVTGGVIILWVIVMFFVLGYLWFTYQ